MHYLDPLRETFRLIVISLFPESVKHNIICNTNRKKHQHYKIFYTIVTEKKVSSCLQGPNLSGYPDETVKLFFPSTYAAAAPFLLFRMKRRGFSASRVTVQDGGLLLTAMR
jgi:hypothetical protein